ncbi:multicopper oxidase family protein [Micrococcales bacterium 31B]|nr:multicopper oxidase family protein [Micrococcales bacterium 31B]
MSFSQFSTRRSGLVVSRRALLGGLTVVGATALAGCSGSHSGHGAEAGGSASGAGDMASMDHSTMDHSTMPGSGAPSASLGPAPAISPSPGQRVVEASLTPKAGVWDLGGAEVQTWAYGGEVPGVTLRATAGDFLRVNVDNQLSADTSVHWHGVRLRNAADGVPGLTQDAIGAGHKYVYEFTAPDPGTYFFHPHVGTQLDRGLYAPLIIEDPDEPGAYDAEWVVVLDDWIDGTGTDPDAVLAGLLDGSGMAGMDHSGMDHGSMGHGSATTTPAPSVSTIANPYGDAGDVQYPHYLINGKTPTAPTTFEAKPGQRVRLRVINAGADTIFALALGGHRLTVTHSDGHAVEPTEAGAFYIGMGERFDATVTLGSGVFPLVAQVVGKPGRAFAIVRTGTGSAPSPDAPVAELAGPVLEGAALKPAAGTRLPTKAPAATLDLTLDGQMMPYAWSMNGKPFGENAPLVATAGERLRLNVKNTTTMVHPLHLHGPAFELVDSGLRKDTLLLKPMESRQIDLDPEVGEWMVHCHNVYHGEAGMMITLSVKA